MKISVLLLATAVFAVGCSSSDDDDIPVSQNDPSIPGDDGTTDTEQETIADFITMDNHVELLRNVLSIYSGKLWADEVLIEPDSGDRLVPTGVEYAADGTGDLISTPVDIVCENGGTVSITPATDGQPADAVTSWDFEFDNCQKGEAVREGQLKREIYESVRFTSADYSNTSQSRQIEFSGDLYYSSFATERADGVGTLITEDVDFTYSNNVDNLVITESNVNYYAGTFTGTSGGFHVKANWTNDIELAVSTIDNLLLVDSAGVIIDQGSFEVRNGDDNVLVFNADTGDVNTVEVSITSDGVTDTVIEPWSLLSDSFRFVTVTGF
ncbi:hypothetical protein [Granulosicoccus antarcticus]|uniref:Lipoprotein n=1 Tax=Granulosicoccus antarcticus IMCC3135 TaxID=1192854 RepID=A0A2Z2NR31_9GAMM|nr:hypothetical protein [Granulosicoccus antarcticus]ASJ73689.1 hypothetical protein IMCC3135_18050 [Granulosicoccus antarcticus IMCC3135]